MISSFASRSNNIRKKLETSELELNDLKQRQLQLRESADEIRRRRREIATRLDERDKVVGELSRARARLESVTKTIRDPKDLEEEMNRERKVTNNKRCKFFF